MPTIKKINLNGTSYDIGGGLTEDVKQGLLNFAEKAAYSGPDYGQEVYDDLYTAFYDNMWNVTNTLSNASTSNPATKTAKDGTYTAIISANTGYTLDGATVSVTMGGANVTSAVYSNGVVNIPAVTGDVVITVVAVALTVVSISAVYTQSGTVYDTDSLNSLKSDLVVTATFNDSSTEVVPSADYTLTGTLTEGTSTITVTYLDKTTTFEVSVEHSIPYPLENTERTIFTSRGSGGTNTFAITITNGNHVKVEAISISDSPLGVTANISSIVSNNNVINNLPTAFTIPADVVVVFEYKNFVGDSFSKQLNTRKANTSTSGAFGTGVHTDLNDIVVSKTLLAAENVGCIFLYFEMSTGTSIEFDVSLTVNGVRWI